MCSVIPVYSVVLMFCFSYAVVVASRPVDKSAGLGAKRPVQDWRGLEIGGNMHERSERGSH